MRKLSKQYALNSLLNRHQYLDAFIKKEQRRLMPDNVLLQKLKKKRLQMKDAVRRLRVEMHRIEKNTPFSQRLHAAP